MFWLVLLYFIWSNLSVSTAEKEKPANSLSKEKVFHIGTRGEMEVGKPVDMKLGRRDF